MYAQLLKFFNALNSSERSWQLSLAITLGMFIGLTPGFAPHNLIIYLLAFFVNVNLGLFILSAAVFALLAYGFDPQIEAVGYALLTAEPLEGVWTAMYNNAWLLLTNFNHSMVIGALAISLVLCIPMYFFVQFLTNKYRLVAVKTPLVKHLVAKPTGKKTGKIRWWGLGLFAGIFGAIGVFTIIFLDPLLKSTLEDLISEPIGYKATIKSLNTSFSPLALTIEGVEVPDSKDPMKNKVYIDRIAFNLDMARVFHKKAVIEEFGAWGIVLESERKTAAKKIAKAAPPPAPPAPPPEPKSTKDVFNDLAQELPDPTNLLKNEQLLTKSEGEKIIARLEEIKAYWDNVIKTKFDKKVFDDIQARYNSLEAKAKNIKNEKDLKAVLDEGKALKKQVDTVRSEYAAIAKAFESDQKESRELLNRIRKLPGEDFDALRKKYSFDLDGAFSLAETLLGSDVGDNLKLALEWYEILKPYIQTAQELKTTVKGEPLPKPVRGASRVVAFKEFNPTPRFLIKKAGFDLTTAARNTFDVAITNATSNQKITRVPMKVAAHSNRVKGYDRLSLEWTNDRVGSAKDSFVFDWLGIEKKGFSKGQFFMDDAKIDWRMTGEIIDGKLDSHATLDYRDAKIGFRDAHGEIQKLIAKTLEGIDKFAITMRFWGKPYLPDSSFSTDLDNLLQKRFKAALEQRIKQFEVELKAAIEKEAKAELAKAGASEADIAALEGLIKGNLSVADVINEKTGKNFSEEGLNKQLKEAAAAELKAQQKKAEEEAKKQLQDQAKKLFKK